MKKLLISFGLLIFSVSLFAQVDLDSAANQAINTKLSSFSQQLDSIVVKSKLSSTTTTVVDTLTVPVGYVTTFFIDLTAENTGTAKDIAGAYKMVQVKNVGGKYTININVDIVKYTGLGTITATNNSWTVTSTAGAAPTVQVIGKAVAMKYTITRTQNVVQL